MLFVTIDQVKSMTNKAVVEGLKAKITSVGKVYSGERDGKKWSKQDVGLKDSTGEIGAKVWDHDPIDASLKGTEVLIEANAGDRGLTGAYAFDDEYNGKVTRVLKITGTGKIIPSDPQQTKTQPTQSSPTQQNQQTTPSQKSASSTDDDEENRRRADKAIMQHAILLERSLDAAAWIAKRFNEKYPSFQFKAEDVRCIAMALQIPAERAGFAGLMPTQLPKDK